MRGQLGGFIAAVAIAATVVAALSGWNRANRLTGELGVVKAELAEAQADAETYARGLRECEAAK